MSKKTNQQVQTSSPWEPQQQYLQDLFSQAQRNFQSGGPQYFSGQTYVPFAQQTEEALRLQEQRARAGSPAEQALGQQLTATLQGDFLNANPYIDDLIDAQTQGITERFNEAVIPGITATFGAGGRTGGGLHAQALSGAAGELGDVLGNVESQIRGQAYESERQRQLQAAGLVPTASALDYQNIDRLRGVGGATEEQARQILADQQRRFDFYQQRPGQNLAQYQGLIGGNYGGTGQSYTRQPASQTIGNLFGLVAGLPF